MKIRQRPSGEETLREVFETASPLLKLDSLMEENVRKVGLIPTLSFFDTISGTILMLNLAYSAIVSVQPCKLKSRIFGPGKC